jgi:hypothetical protein
MSVIFLVISMRHYFILFPLLYYQMTERKKENKKSKSKS